MIWEIQRDPIRKQGAVEKAAPQTNIKQYPASGILYRQEIDIDENGNEIITDVIINNKEAARIKTEPLTKAAVQKAQSKGFHPDTVSLVYKYWAQGMTQARIAKAAGISLSTVQHITPSFRDRGNKNKKTRKGL